MLNKTKKTALAVGSAFVLVQQAFSGLTPLVSGSMIQWYVFQTLGLGTLTLPPLRLSSAKSSGKAYGL